MRYLLDTNILLGCLRGSTLYSRVDQELQLSNPANDILISAVTKAELMSLAIGNNWGAGRLRALTDLLNKLIIVDIDSSNTPLFEAYSKLDCYSQSRLPGHSLPPGKTARKMGKNDLWIASTAFVAKATLVTTDRDFDNLWPTYITVKYYP